MFVVNDDLSIYLTRGDTLFFKVTAKDHGYPYTFRPGDIVRISVTGKKDVTAVYLQKDFPVYNASKTVYIYLDGEETKIGEKISKQKDYRYEIVLNPDTAPQTIIGNDDEGVKIFRLFPESDDREPVYPEPEEIPVVDAELDLTSERPVSNRAVAAAIARLTAAIEELRGVIPQSEDVEGSVFNALGQIEALSMIAIDAYGVAVKNGFEGTVEEWLASLKGEKGEPGKDGAVKFSELTEAEKAEIKGDPGKDGVPAEHSWNGTVLTIKSASGTSSADLKGEPGNDGYTPVKGVDYFDGSPGKDGTNGKDGANGKDGQNGYTPVRGTDYWTAADIAEIKSYVDDAILGGEW